MSKKGGAAVAAQMVKLIVPAGKASAQPPVGPALGARGVKAMDFAKEFNAKTAHLEAGIPTPCVVTVNPDRTFSFELKTPTTALLLCRAAGVTQGSGATGSQTIGTVSLKHVYEIAKIKSPDIPSISEQQVCKTIVGTAKSMGIRVIR
ncbi:hypothetical protein IEQ34_025452 [Dendrobium chrysotoxum]|uniref:Large ribosomal subunit protein uL11m n=1 Tax=Dendrobium chrysotoxum TaxID=161865 RepID=A0AAV7FJ13_DENCH|nr:hypothetical protein IEQ34_025452 [Dendrobium chrysotoxum]